MGALHPQVVHFAIAFLVAGVLFRALSLVTRERFTFVGPMAATLLTLGTIAIVAAALTGDAAHGPVEAMPGVRPAVEAHEEWGESARNVFIIVFLIEVALLLLRTSRYARYLLIGSTVVGLAGLVVLYQAGERGGEIVYGYAGGVGIRSGDPEDVKRLLLAGLYQQALIERKAGNKDRAYELLEEAARLYPDNVDVQLTHVESLLTDRGDTTAAIDRLQAIKPPADNRFLRTRHAMLTADALAATGQRDGAVAVLQQLQADAPSPRVQQKIEEIRQMPPAAAQP